MLQHKSFLENPLGAIRDHLENTVGAKAALVAQSTPVVDPEAERQAKKKDRKSLKAKLKSGGIKKKGKLVSSGKGSGKGGGGKSSESAGGKGKGKGGGGTGKGGGGKGKSGGGKGRSGGKGKFVDSGRD